MRTVRRVCCVSHLPNISPLPRSPLCIFPLLFFVEHRQNVAIVAVGQRRDSFLHVAVNGGPQDPPDFDLIRSQELHCGFGVGREHAADHAQRAQH